MADASTPCSTFRMYGDAGRSKTTATARRDLPEAGDVPARYPISATAASTRSRVLAATSRRPLSALEAVAGETPAARATSASVGLLRPTIGSHPLETFSLWPSASSRSSRSLA